MITALKSIVISNAKMLSGVLLVTGTTIGAGMLALPVKMAQVGFIPSLALFLITWSFMTFTAFLILECNLAVGPGANLITMSRKTLGPLGEVVSWLTYLLLLYALITAYISGAGSLLLGVISYASGWHFPVWIGSTFLMGFMALIIYIGMKAVDQLNRILMGGCFLFFLLLLGGVLGFIRVENLLGGSVTYSLLPLPILVTAFGFHIVIPSLVRFFNGSIFKSRICLFIGSIIPLLIYLIWQFAILGLLPLEGKNGLLTILSSEDHLVQMNYSIQQITGNGWVGGVASCFSFFAIMTSLLGVMLSLSDFIADGMSSFKFARQKLTIFFLAFVPPFVISALCPNIFMSALGYAGVFVSILLGALPIAMCWYGRKLPNWPQSFRVPGGKFMLSIALFFFLTVITMQFLGQDALGEVEKENLTHL